MKKLIINADDFGLTAGVNEAILDGHLRGTISSASLLANGEAFESAVISARRAPRLGVGVHLNLSEGRPLTQPAVLPSLTDRHGSFSRKPARLWLAKSVHRVNPGEIEKECRAQIEKVLAAGIVPTHLDSHKHVHALPFLGRMLMGLAFEYGIPAIRRVAESRAAFGCLIRRYPACAPVILRQLATSCALAKASESAMGQRQNIAVASPSHFYGQTATGFLDEHVLGEILAHIPEGVSELMCHPGFVDDALRRMPTRLLRQREIEHRVLTRPATRSLMEKLDIQLISYRDVFCLPARARVSRDASMNQCA